MQIVFCLLNFFFSSISELSKIILNNYMNPHSHPSSSSHLLNPSYTFLEVVFFFFFQCHPHFSQFMMNFANLKPRTYSTQFYLSNEIHDDILSDSSSHKYLYFIVQIFIPILVSIYLQSWTPHLCINLLQSSLRQPFSNKNS